MLDNPDHQRRLAEIQSVLNRVSSGDLASRVNPVGGDGLTAIEVSLNETLDRTDELVASLRDGTRVLIHEMKYPFIAARSWMVRARDQLPPSNLRDDLDRLIVQIDEARAATEIMAEISLQIADRHDRTGFVDTDLRSVCEDVILELSDFARSRGQLIKAEISTAQAFGRDHLLFVALRNLVHNACTHSPLQSHIVVRCGAHGALAWLEVEDCGAGVPQEIRDEMQSGRSVPLRQRDSRTAIGGGLGLGLRLSKAIFRRHRAVMMLRDRRPGPGTILRVELPTY